MKKRILDLVTLVGLVWLCSFAIVSCDDKNVDYPDTKLIKGQWQLIDNNIGNLLIYSFTAVNETSWPWGGLTTYYLSADGTITYDKRYTWHVSDPAADNNGKIRMDLTWLDAPDASDSDKIWEAAEYYIIVKLTPSEMWLRPDSKGGSNEIMKFTRRYDLPVPPKPQVWSDKNAVLNSPQ